MKKYMVVYLVEGETCASFYDTTIEADDARVNIVCGLGGHAEVYVRRETEFGKEYVFLYA